MNTQHLSFITFSKAVSFGEVISVFCSADAILMAKSLQNHATLPSVQAQSLLAKLLSLR